MNKYSKSYPIDLLPKNVTYKFSLPALGRLINPFSSMLGGGELYVPEWMIKMFDTGKFHPNNKIPAKMAHILAKITAGGAVFGGAAYLLRAFMHSLDIDNIESMKAGNRASQKLLTTKIRPIAPALEYLGEYDDLDEDDLLNAAVEQAQKAKQLADKENRLVTLPMTKKLNYRMMVGALPPLIALASMITAFKLADKTFDSSLGSRLDTLLAQAEAKSQAMALKRIKENRGILLADPAQIQKVAMFLGIQSALGLLLAVVLTTGGIVGFNWHRENSPAVAKYKAYKNGLETYNKHRSLQLNILNSPLSDALVEELDSNLKGNKKKPASAQQIEPMNEVLV